MSKPIHEKTWYTNTVAALEYIKDQNLLGHAPHTKEIAEHLGVKWQTLQNYLTVSHKNAFPMLEENVTLCNAGKGYTLSNLLEHTQPQATYQVKGAKSKVLNGLFDLKTTLPTFAKNTKKYKQLKDAIFELEYVGQKLINFVEGLEEVEG